MKWLAVITIVVIAGMSVAYAEKGTHFDSVRFIQYLDENTALEEVRNGNLDIYYYTIPSDRLESYQGDDSLQIFDSAGVAYSLLANPAETEQFNPFSLRDVRFALNYIVDRKLIVNELMGGYGVPITTYYGPSNPEYLTVISELESFNFEYNPRLAAEMINGAMSKAGAEMINGVWHADGEQVEITIFIRSDDPLRKSIGEIISSEMEEIGFVVKKEFGDLNKAFVVVYGSDPADFKWHLYTEGWGSSAFVRYDPVGLSQMYSPWFSNMPGFNNPAYWNYENDKLDDITRRIYSADFDSAEERTGLIREAVSGGISESVRVFLASKTNQYVANSRVEGIINDFGAGVPGRFTPINARADTDHLTIGVKQIYQGAWNPVAGLSDTYSRHIWGAVHDPGTFNHPYTGEKIPVRSVWDVETAGPRGVLDVPEDAILWNPEEGQWGMVGSGINATSKVVFEMKLGNWHHGEMMDVNDILYSAYFISEWGTQTGPDDKTFDTEFTPRAAQIVQTLKGIRVVGENTVEAYVDYWHFDEKEIAGWANLWSTTPWEVSAAMEQAVLDGKVSYSRSGGTSKGIGWLSLLIPNDATLVKEYLEGFKERGFAPVPLDDPGNVNSRYDAAISWIEENDHAVISNGPYYMESYSPESRAITMRAFADESYPFGVTRWSEFEDARAPQIAGADIADVVVRGQPLEIRLEVYDSDSVMYFLGGSGDVVTSGELDVSGNVGVISIPSDVTGMLDPGTGSIRVFAISESVLKPDYYESSFVVSDSGILSENESDVIQVAESRYDYGAWILPAVVIGIVVYAVRYRLVCSRARRL